MQCYLDQFHTFFKQIHSDVFSYFYQSAINSPKPLDSTSPQYNAIISFIIIIITSIYRITIIFTILISWLSPNCIPYPALSKHRIQSDN